MKIVTFRGPHSLSFYSLITRGGNIYAFEIDPSDVIRPCTITKLLDVVKTAVEVCDMEIPDAAHLKPSGYFKGNHVEEHDDAGSGMSIKPEVERGAVTRLVYEDRIEFDHPTEVAQYYLTRRGSYKAIAIDGSESRAHAADYIKAFAHHDAEVCNG